MKELFIVAGGPSLREFDFSRLEGRTHLAINRSYEVCPQASILWWSDKRFFDWHHEGLKKHKAPIKASGLRKRDHHTYPDWVKVWKFTGIDGFDQENLRSGNNSTYAAIHLAVHLGYRRIVLLGVDMCFSGGKSHWHEGHGVEHKESTLKEKMLPYFDTLAPHLEEMGVEVINANPDSELKVWPRVKIDEVLT